MEKQMFDFIVKRLFELLVKRVFELFLVMQVTL